MSDQDNELVLSVWDPYLIYSSDWIKENTKSFKTKLFDPKKYDNKIIDAYLLKKLETIYEKELAKNQKTYFKVYAYLNRSYKLKFVNDKNNDKTIEDMRGDFKEAYAKLIACKKSVFNTAWNIGNIRFDDIANEPHNWLPIIQIEGQETGIFSTLHYQETKKFFAELPLGGGIIPDDKKTKKLREIINGITLAGKPFEDFLKDKESQTLGEEELKAKIIKTDFLFTDFIYPPKTMLLLVYISKKGEEPVEPSGYKFTKQFLFLVLLKEHLLRQNKDIYRQIWEMISNTGLTPLPFSDFEMQQILNISSRLDLFIPDNVKNIDDIMKRYRVEGETAWKLLNKFVKMKPVFNEDGTNIYNNTITSEDILHH